VGYRFQHLRGRGYSKTLVEKYGVTFTTPSKHLCKNVDCVLLKAWMASPTWSRFPVIKAGKIATSISRWPGLLHDVGNLPALA
jgi:hypothetical protein